MRRTRSTDATASLAAPIGRRFVAASILVHAAVLFGVPLPEPQAPQASPVRVVLRPAAPPAPAAAPDPVARPATQPPRPAAAAPRLGIAPQPDLRSAEVAPAPTPAPAPAPTAVLAPPVAPPVAAPVAAPVAVSAPDAPAVVAAVPERRGKPSTLWLAEYTQVVSGQVARLKQYPQIARLRGWQGTTVITLQLSPNGTIIETRITQSSGHEVLDRQAMQMVRLAEPLPPLPAASAEPLEVRLPIVFTLAAKD